MKNTLFSIGKGTLWVTFTLLFGLLQLWIVILIECYIVKPVEFHYIKILTDGALLFFSSAVVSAVCIDYYLGNGKPENFSKLASFFLYFIYPIVVLMVCVLISSICFFTTPEKLDMEFVKSLQVAVIIMTVLYALIAKSIMFFQEYEN